MSEIHRPLTKEQLKYCFINKCPYMCYGTCTKLKCIAMHTPKPNLKRIK